ncbi:alpha/beta hydrolase [Ottowia thiooxydans]|uniref:Arylformamidase n=1 Tax=Ottowia thiooxydans TaxID=219182 RepID=A0ABV2Q2U3_9BURK
MTARSDSPSAALYRGMDQPTLERQYNARASVPSFDVEYAATVRDSAQVQVRCTDRVSCVYDERSGEMLDLYRTGLGSPVFLWIHGGYWRAGSRHDNAFAAGGLVAQGISVAVMDYTLAPTASIGEIVRQVRTAVQWLVRAEVTRGLHTERIHVGGSSAGGHLVGMLLADGWTQDFGLPDDVIGVALALSGLYDLTPLQHVQVNGWMRFTPEEIAAQSPERWIPARSHAHLLTAVGGHETDEFRRQTADYAARWRQAGHAGQTVPMPEYNHFDIARTLVEPDGTLVRAVRDAILSPPARN